MKQTDKEWIDGFFAGYKSCERNDIDTITLLTAKIMELARMKKQLKDCIRVLERELRQEQRIVWKLQDKLMQSKTP